MSFSDDFRVNLEALPNILQRKYSLLRDLDKSLQDNQRQNEQRCEQEMDEMKRVVKSGNTHDTSLIRFSDEALEEQKHSQRIADEKVALAQQVYDLVDGHIQQLDQFLKKYDEELRRESAAAITTPVSSSEKSGKRAEGGRGRKKTRLAVTAAAGAATEAATSASNPTAMDIDIPVDPNEPTYCFCNQVSYGEMVACDNTNCKIEWFHFGCVGLKEQPKGKWYCSECSAQKRRKGK
uniref:PHD finger protein ING n=1 Tax=Kalanchoe fedtschenkoi TaxID=63787 RepID=A0A7N0UT71_KALFE